MLKPFLEHKTVCASSRVNVNDVNVLHCGDCQTLTAQQLHCTESWNTTTGPTRCELILNSHLAKWMRTIHFRIEVSAGPEATCFYSCRQECKTRVIVCSSFQKTVYMESTGNSGHDNWSKSNNSLQSIWNIWGKIKKKKKKFKDKRKV